MSDHECCKCWRCCDCGKPREVAAPAATVPVELKRRTPEETAEYWQKTYVEQGAEIRRLRERVAWLEASDEAWRIREELGVRELESRAVTAEALVLSHEGRIETLEAKLRRECSDEDLEALGITPDVAE